MAAGVDDLTRPAVVARMVVLVTGAAAGIGRAIALDLLNRGHRVIAVDRDGDALAGTFAHHDDTQALPLVCDVSREEDATRCVKDGEHHFGRLDALVNNAAVHGEGWLKPCLNYDQADWARLFAINVFAIPLLARAARAALAASGGTIVNLSSMVGYGSGPSSPYAVSKAAVNGMTMALSEELGRDGIRVVGLAPGFIATPTVMAAMGEEAQRRVKARQAIPTTGTPEDIAEIIAFLISPAARLITGATIVADLGITRRP